MNSIEINSKSIQIARPRQNEYTFGEAKHKHFLNSGGEIIGFLNALSDYMGGLYPVCVPGFHSKVLFDSLALETKGEARAYVNFDMLTDQGIIEKLAGFGIKKLPDKVGWLVLNTSWGRFVPSHYAHPKTSLEVLRAVLPVDYDEMNTDDQKNARNQARETLHPDIFRNNEHEWAIIHKHNGLSLVLLLLEDKLQVVARNTKGFEWQDKSIEQKAMALFADPETRLEQRQRITNNMNEKAATARGGWNVRQYSEYEARADQVVAEEGLFVLKGDDLVEVNPVDLIKKRIELWFNGQREHTRFALNLSEVKGNILFAKANNFTIHI